MAVISVMDSGVGGLSVLRELVKVLPGEHFIYYGDSAFCPYGEKSQEFVLDRVRAITKEMISKGADIMVIACNTATAAAISSVRKEFDIPFVGMEPAVKPAALGTRSGVIGVLATAGTLKGSKYLNTKEIYEEDVKIAEHVGKGFVELVESGELCGEHCEKTVRASLEPLLDEGADTIVLGCTHYPFLIDTMQKIAGPDIRFIDPAPAVARQTVNVMTQNKIGTSGLGHPDIELLSSGSVEQLKKSYDLLLV